MLAFIFVSLEPKPNGITKVEVNNKNSYRYSSAGTKADSEQKVEDLFVSQHSSKPLVGRRQSLFGCLQLVFIQVFFKLSKSHFLGFFCNFFFDFTKNFDCVKSLFFFSCRLHYILFLLVNECQVVNSHNVNLLNCSLEF